MYGNLGVLNYDTVYHLSSLLGIGYTRIMKICIKQVMGMLDYQMMVEVFLFLLVFNKWKSGKFIVVISPWRWLIISRIENPNMCVCVCVCKLCCSLWLCTHTHIHRHIDSNSNYVRVCITLNLRAYVTMNSGLNLLLEYLCDHDIWRIFNSES